MNCPSCNNPLIVLEHEQIEVDFCANCEGVWLDAGELEMICGDAAAVARVLEHSGMCVVRGERARRCPICNTKMGKATSPLPSPVTYDRCLAGHGLWFDRGELAQLLGEGELAGAGSLKEFLRQVFA